MKWSKAFPWAGGFITPNWQVGLHPIGLLILLILFAHCSTGNHKFTVATAASSQFAMRELIDSFELTVEYSVDLVVGSSGSLTARILAGAPYDLLISADDRYPEKLANAGETLGEARIFAYNSLVLWTNDPELSLSLDQFDPDDPPWVSLASPISAPFGQLADSLLRLRPDYPALVPRLIYGGSISTVNNFVNIGVGYGLTARSIVHERRVSKAGRWVDFHPEARLPQTAVILRGEREEEARAFMLFLASPAGKRILLRNGYRLPAD